MLIPEEEIRVTHSAFPQELSVVAKNAYNLMVSIIKLRQEYKEAGLLPLDTFNTDFENLNMKILYCIEQETLKFGRPCTLTKNFQELTDSDLRGVCADESEFLNMGFDEWEDEGLFDFKKYKNNSVAKVIHFDDLKQK